MKVYLKVTKLKPTAYTSYNRTIFRVDAVKERGTLETLLVNDDYPYGDNSPFYKYVWDATEIDSAVYEIIGNVKRHFNVTEFFMDEVDAKFL